MNTMKSMWFEDFGQLEWLDQDQYYDEPWRYVGAMYGEDGNVYDIVEMRLEYRYTDVDGDRDIPQPLWNGTYDDYPEAEEELTHEEIIEEREEELDVAIEDFVITVTDDSVPLENYEEIIRDLKEHFLAYMYKKHGLEPFRPMILYDEDKTEHYEEFPYRLLFEQK